MKKLIFFLLFAGILFSCKSPKKMDGNLNTSKLKLFIGTYTEQEAHVDGQAAGIYTYSFDLETGALDSLHISPYSMNPSYIALHPSKRFLYAVNEASLEEFDGAGSISSFVVDTVSGALQFINKVSSQGSYPCHIDIDKTGQFAFVANYGGGNTSMHPLDVSGTVQESSFNFRHEGNGPHPNQSAPHGHMAKVSRDNQALYSVDLGSDKVFVNKIDAVSKKLIRADYDIQSQAGSGPRHISFHPNAEWAYIVHELDGTIAFVKLSQDGSNEVMQVVATHGDGPNAEALCADIHVSPDGKFLYASNRGEVNNIAMFSIDEQSGELTLLGHQATKGKAPRNFVIDPTGNFLLVANQDSSNIIVFRINKEDGSLTDTGIEKKVPTPVCLVFMPE